MSSLDDELSELMQISVLPTETASETDEKLVEFMSHRIEELLAGQFDALMSMMYRLDIDEIKIRKALTPGNSDRPAINIARLIVDRQKRRMATKKQYQPPSFEDWIEFE